MPSRSPWKRENTLTSGGLIEVHVNFGSDAEARGVSRSAVEQRLAACANILAPIHSLYWWDGAVRSEDEVAVVFKTSPNAVDRLVDFIAGHHSYDVPGIVVHGPLGANRPYLDWIARETSA